MSDYVTSDHAKKLRRARHDVRRYQRCPTEINRRRFQQACALLAAHVLSGRKVNRDAKSAATILPIHISLDEQTDSAQDAARPLEQPAC